MKTFLVVLCASLVFFSVFRVHGSIEKLRHDFNHHWHYSPQFIPDFRFDRIRIFNDEGVGYNLTPVKRKAPTESWIHYCVWWR